MDDSKIVDLYLSRDESAIKETETKYGRYLMKIAYNILSDLRDSEESVNDTYLRAWNSIPPHKPNVLSTYLGKITRQLSIDIYRKKNGKKREGSTYAISLEELSDCVSGKSTPEQEMEFKLLAEAIGKFLKTLPDETRNIFVCRYYFMDSIKEIASYCGSSESKIKSTLYRTRNGLKEFLESE